MAECERERVSGVSEEVEEGEKEWRVKEGGRDGRGGRGKRVMEKGEE